MLICLWWYGRDPSSVIRNPITDDRKPIMDTSHEQISRLRAELNQVQRQIDSAEEELARLEEDLRAFEFEFEANVGYLLEQLTQLEAEVNDYLQRIKIMRAEKTFGEGYRNVEDQFDEKWNAPRRNTPKPPPPKPPPLTAAQLKKLYRELARRYHPDLALDEADRAYRTTKMMAINDAYKAGSLTELMALAAEKDKIGLGTAVPMPTSPPPSKPSLQTEHEMVYALEEELERSRRRLFRVQDALQNFHHRPMVELALEARFARREGRDVLAEMAVELQRKIARKEVEREMIKSQFDHLI